MDMTYYKLSFTCAAGYGRLEEYFYVVICDAFSMSISFIDGGVMCHQTLVKPRFSLFA